ncbi:Imm10 family immunity protein [Kosakonia sp.]|uniref:Imm10 family immunity protein n=1 Tax=Kosakonia sp. TaxID=1916651 RepID=UPI00289A6ED4|nr:Imm10 family immunity protein [Kosakonia sp.]
MSANAAFTATRIHYTEEDDVYILGVGDDDEEPEHFFIISRFDEEDEPVDKCIGFQSDATEYELTAAIASIVLSNKSVTVTLTDSAAQVTGIQHTGATFKAGYDPTELCTWLQALTVGSTIRLVIEE